MWLVQEYEGDKMKVLIAILSVLCSCRCGEIESSSIQREVFKDIPIYRCVCSNPNSYQSIELSELLANINLVVFGSGTCHACKDEGLALEEIYSDWKDKDFSIIEVFISDDQYAINLPDLLAYCCKQKYQYGLSFILAMDPNAQKSKSYYNAIPYNVILNKKLEMLFEQEGWNKTVIEEAIKEAILND